MKAFAFNLVMAGVMFAGDGSGGRLSPYSASDKITSKLVSEMWTVSNNNRTAFLEPHPAGSPRIVLLAWTQASGPAEPLKTLAGIDALGQRRQIDLAVLSQLKVVSIDSARRTISADVEVFPDISPDDLVKTQPTYRELMAKYRKVLQLRIETIDAKGRTLALIDAKTRESVGSPIANVSQGTVVIVLPHKPTTVNRSSLWWAIPSVMDDPQYPYRFATGA